MLEERGEKPEPPQMGKLGAGAMICAKTLTDKSEAHLAEMLILGSTRGVIDVTHKLREYKDCDDAIKNLGFKLLWTEQTNIDELKKFL